MASNTIVTQTNEKVNMQLLSMYMADEGGAAAYFYEVSLWRCRSSLESLWRRYSSEQSWKKV